MNFRYVFKEKTAKTYERARFDMSQSRITDHVITEINRIHGLQPTILAGYRQVRNDGLPYSNARPEHPEAELQVTKSVYANGRWSPKVLTFRSFKYDTFADNMRAIGLTMEALRALDRWGVTEGQQYSGFAQIEAPKAEADAQWLAGVLRVDVADLTANPGAFRNAAIKATHPDRAGQPEFPFAGIENYRRACAVVGV